MQTRLILAGLAAVIAGTAGSAVAANDFIVSTDRVAYTGTVSTFDTIDDAIAGANATGVYAIPNRATDAPFNTPNRDVAVYFANNYFGDNSNTFLTAWYYTTNADNGEYSGWGNPNNTNTGFVQLYDDDGSTTLTKDASFGDFDGTHWTSFSMNASGEFATYADDFGRLWPAPTVGGASNISSGLFYTWDLNITFGGLQGTETAGVIEATDHPDSVMGTFSAVFINEGANSALNGFYRADFTFNMDSWAFGNSGSLNGEFDDSYFAVLPAPTASALFGMAGLGAMRRRRR